MVIKNWSFRFSHFYSMLIMWSSYKRTFFIHLCMKMKTKHELQLLHSAHKRLSVSHMPVHVIDFPITITKFSITLPITSYVAIFNYNYHYHYFSKVIICNRLQLQITITTSLVCIVIFAYETWCFWNQCTTLKTNIFRYYSQVTMLKEVYLLH